MGVNICIIYFAGCCVIFISVRLIQKNNACIIFAICCCVSIVKPMSDKVTDNKKLAMCHGSTFLSAYFVERLNHAHEVGKVESYAIPLRVLAESERVSVLQQKLLVDAVVWYKVVKV